MRKMIFDKKKEPCTDVRQAQGMVEFALVLPILLLLVFGIIEFGRLLFMFASVTSASREAARYGAAVGDTGGGTLRYQDCDGIVAAASRVGVLAGITAADVIIQYDDGTNIKANSCADVQDVYGSPIYLGDRILVTVTRQFQPIVPLVNIPAIPISATTARTIIRDVGVKGTPLPTRTKIPTLTPTETLVPTITETPKKTDKKSPTATSTTTNTPVPPTATAGPSPTNPGPPPTPACEPADYEIVEYLQPDIVDNQAFWSVYIRIRNDSESELTITGIDFDWPPPDEGQGSELYLQEIRFDVSTGWDTSCGVGTTCLWNGASDYITSISVCDTGCDESFSGGLANRLLTIGQEKDLKFVFSNPLKSSFNDGYNPNPYPYNVRVIFDNSCYIETLETQYIRP